MLWKGKAVYCGGCGERMRRGAGIYAPHNMFLCINCDEVKVMPPDKEEERLWDEQQKYIAEQHRKGGIE